MGPLGRDFQRSSLREVLPASRSWGSGVQRLIAVLITVLTTLAWAWLVLATEALWELVLTLDSLMAAAASPLAAMEAAGPVDLAGVPPDPQQSSAARPPPGAPLSNGIPRSAIALRKHAIEEHAERPIPLLLPGAPQFHGAICTGVFVYIVTIAEGRPSRSAVSFATSETARTNFAHPGERVDGWELLAITDDWTGANPVVWLLRKDEVCLTGLTGNPARLEAILQREEQELQARRARRRRRR